MLELAMRLKCDTPLVYAAFEDLTDCSESRPANAYWALTSGVHNFLVANTIGIYVSRQRSTDCYGEQRSHRLSSYRSDIILENKRSDIV